LPEKDLRKANEEHPNELEKGQYAAQNKVNIATKARREFD